MVLFTDNIIGLQAHPEMYNDEAEKLILPAISKKFNWSQEKTDKMGATFHLDVDDDKMNQAIKKFMDN
jgi:hypothetical protein